MAGGVALNCVANWKILKEKIFENVWIQPAAGDAGGALGAALALWHQELKQERLSPLQDDMQGSYLGPQYKLNGKYMKYSSFPAYVQKVVKKRSLAILIADNSLESLCGYILIIDSLNLNFRKLKLNKNTKCKCNNYE